MTVWHDLRGGRRWAAWGLLLAIPVTVVALLLWIRGIQGPYWLALNYDPAYAYLLNSLAIAEGRAPALVEHPGTPLEVLGAVVLRTIHAFRAGASLRADVLGDAELYLRGIHGALTALYGLALLLVGGVTFARTRSLAAALLMQAPPLLACGMLPLHARVMPESLLMTVGALFCLVALLHVWRPLEEASGVAPTGAVRPRPVLFGILVGVGVGTKLTFAPLALAPFVLLPSRRSRLVYALAAPAAFIVATAPALPRLLDLVRFHARWATHTGTYGEGEAGLFDRGNVGLLLSVLSQSALLPVVLAASAVALLALWRVGRTAALSDRARDVRRGLFAFVLVAAGAALMLLKQPRFHYLVPVLSCLGLGLVLLVEASRLGPGERAWFTGGHKGGHDPLARAPRRPYGGRGAHPPAAPDHAGIPRPWGAALALALLGYVCTTQRGLIERWSDVTPRTAGLELQARHEAGRTFPAAARVCFYRASSECYAFQAARSWADGWFDEDLRRQYPDRYLWHFQTGEYSSFGRRVGLEEIARAHREVVFQGEDFDGDTHPGLAVAPPRGVVLERVFRGRRESLYRLVRLQDDPEAPAVIQSGPAPNDDRIGQARPAGR